MQVQEGARRNMRRADLHPDARGPIQHPGRHHDDHTGRRLNMNELTSAPSFTVKPPNTPPVQRMPAIMDFDFLPDMGRMNGRLCSIAKTRSLPVTIRGRRTGPALLRSSKPANCTASTRKPTSPTCSPSSSISGPPRVSTNSCPGPGGPSVPPTNSRRDTPNRAAVPAKKSSRQSQVIRGPLTLEAPADGSMPQLPACSVGLSVFLFGRAGNPSFCLSLSRSSRSASASANSSSRPCMRPSKSSTISRHSLLLHFSFFVRLGIPFLRPDPHVLEVGARRGCQGRPSLCADLTLHRFQAEP